MYRDPIRIIGRTSRIGGVPATRLANARGSWRNALVVDKVMRLLGSNHETDLAVGPLGDEAKWLCPSLQHGRMVPFPSTMRGKTR
jgi:hypothetical protein